VPNYRGATYSAIVFFHLVDIRKCIGAVKCPADV